MASEWDVVETKPLSEWDVVSSEPLKSAKKTTKAKPSYGDLIKPEFETYGNLLAGAVRGAGSIGATIVGARDAAEQGIANLIGAKDYVAGVPNRRAEMTNALQSMGADPNSLAFQGAKMGTEVAGTLGAGPALGAGATALNMPRFGAALASFGGGAGQGANWLQRVGGGTVSGGASAGLADPDAAGLGLAFGAAVPGVVEPIIKLGKKFVINPLYRIAEPYLPGGMEQIKGRTLNAMAGERAPQVIEALERPQTMVPGSAPNAGEAAAYAGAAPFASLQERVKDVKGASSEYYARQKAAEEARLAAVRRIGADETALDAAIKARQTAAQTNYGEAEKQLVKADSELHELLSRPSMDKALKRAAELADEARKGAFIVGKDAPAKVIQGLIVDESGKPLTQMVIPATSAKYPVQSLHYIKMAMDDMVKNPERFAIGANEQKAILGTKAKFIDWLGKKSPDYDFARTEHARLSRPINKMEVGQYLENKLSSPIEAERPAAFAQGMRDAPTTLKKSTGNARYTDLKQVLEPSEVNSLNNVLADLNRFAEYKRLASAGGQEAGLHLGSEFFKHEPPGMLHSGVMVARNVLNRIQGKATEKTLEQLAIDMQNPRVVAALMKAATAKERAILEKAFNIRGPLVTGSALATEQ